MLVSDKKKYIVVSKFDRGTNETDVRNYVYEKDYLKEKFSKLKLIVPSLLSLFDDLFNTYPLMTLEVLGLKQNNVEMVIKNRPDKINHIISCIEYRIGILINAGNIPEIMNVENKQYTGFSENTVLEAKIWVETYKKLLRLDKVYQMIGDEVYEMDEM